MESIKLKLKNYKCFQEAELDINNLTILLGANAAGKSSIIQSVLLYLKAVNVANSENKANISLYKDFGYDMGVIEHLLYKNAEDENIVLEVDEHQVTINLKNQPKLSDVITAETEHKDISYAYLCAERLGPRNTIEYHNSENCGIHGEYTPYIISKIGERKADIHKWFGTNLGETFSAQLDDWVQFIFPDIKVQASCQFNKIALLQVNSKGNWLIPTHVGFGVSYALPILVDGLRLLPGSWFIVENPEAHLQPKAQTQIGYFLGRMAAAGLRVIVETHSEHILEGIAAVVQSKEYGILKDHVSVFVLEQTGGCPCIRKASLQRSGVSKDEFPTDFFDYGKEQIQKDIESCSKKLEDIGDMLL